MGKSMVSCKFSLKPIHWQFFDLKPPQIFVKPNMMSGRDHFWICTRMPVTHQSIQKIPKVCWISAYKSNLEQVAMYQWHPVANPREHRKPSQISPEMGRVKFLKPFEAWGGCIVKCFSRSHRQAEGCFAGGTLCQQWSCCSTTLGCNYGSAWTGLVWMGLWDVRQYWIGMATGLAVPQ